LTGREGNSFILTGSKNLLGEGKGFLFAVLEEKVKEEDVEDGAYEVR